MIMMTVTVRVRDTDAIGWRAGAREVAAPAALALIIMIPAGGPEAFNQARSQSVRHSGSLEGSTVHHLGSALLVTTKYYHDCGPACAVTSHIISRHEFCMTTSSANQVFII